MLIDAGTGVKHLKEYMYQNQYFVMKIGKLLVLQTFENRPLHGWGICYGNPTLPYISSQLRQIKKKQKKNKYRKTCYKRIKP